MIKKLFAIFCAFCLMPLMSAQAWIGGPFSNNSYFSDNGDDGVYEAVGTATNGVGIFRIVVGNSFDGVNATAVATSIPVTTQQPPGVTFTTGGLASGNITIGGLGLPYALSSNIWYYQGVSYFGASRGIVNSVLGEVICVANANDQLGGGTNTVGSFFRARLASSGAFLPARSFSGSGELRESQAPAVAVPFTVFGTKVSSQITFGL